MLENDAVNGSYTDSAKEIRKQFTDYVDSSSPSIAKIASDSNNASKFENKDNAIEAYTLSMTNASETSTTVYGNTIVEISENMRKTFELWQCGTEEGVDCDNLIMTVMSAPSDVLSTEENTDTKLVSNVVKIEFNNPRTYKIHANPTNMSVHLTFDAKAGFNKTIAKCYHWNSTVWKHVSDADSSANDGSAKCKDLQKTGYYAVFEYTDPGFEVVVEVEEAPTEAPSTPAETAEPTKPETTAPPATNPPATNPKETQAPVTEAQATEKVTEKAKTQGNHTNQNKVSTAGHQSPTDTPKKSTNKAGDSEEKPKSTKGTVEENGNRNDTDSGETENETNENENEEVVVKKKTIELTFAGDFKTLGLDNDTIKEEFKVEFKTQLSTKLNISKTRIDVTDVRSGSVIVTFDILPSPNVTGQAGINEINNLYKNTGYYC